MATMNESSPPGDVEAAVQLVDTEAAASDLLLPATDSTGSQTSPHSAFFLWKDTVSVLASWLVVDPPKHVRGNLLREIRHHTRTCT